MDLGEKIRMFRMNAGLTQTKLGEMIEVAPRTISKWESGTTSPGLPEIRKICKALNIKKSDLIEEEDVKKEVGKPKGVLESNKQSYLKGLASATSIISRILRVLLWVGIVCLIICIVFMPVFFNSFDINGHVIRIKGMDKPIELVNDGGQYYKVKVGDKISDLDIDIDIKTMDRVLDNYSKVRVVCFLEVSFIISLASMFILIVMLKDVEKLANNVGEGDVFAEENPILLRNIGYLMIAMIVIPFLAGIVPNAVMDTNFGEDFSLANIIEILIVFALSYIFEYGYKLAKKTNLPIYNEN